MSRCGKLGVVCGNRIFVILPTLDDTSAPRVHPVHPVADRAIAAAVRGGSTGTHAYPSWIAAVFLANPFYVARKKKKRGSIGEVGGD